MRRSFWLVLTLLAVGLSACASQAARADSDPPRVLVSIHDQGSTNTRRWILTIYRDGGGSLRRDGSRDRSFRPGTFHGRALAIALHALDSATASTCPGGTTTAPVMVGSGSVSFGSIAWLVYRGREIRSICTDNRDETALSMRLSKAVATARP